MIAGRDDRVGAARALMAGLFGRRVINDRTGVIALHVPEPAEPGVPVAIGVQVDWNMVLAEAVVHLYLVVARERDAFLGCWSLVPDMVPPDASITVRRVQVVPPQVEADGGLFAVTA
jgi:hypothetical protein